MVFSKASSCCCCFDVRTGSLIIGYLAIVAYIFNIIVLGVHWAIFSMYFYCYFFQIWPFQFKFLIFSCRFGDKSPNAHWNPLCKSCSNATIVIYVPISLNYIVLYFNRIEPSCIDDTKYCACYY